MKFLLHYSARQCTFRWNQREKWKWYVIIIIPQSHSLKYCSYLNWQLMGQDRCQPTKIHPWLECEATRYRDGRRISGLSGCGWKRLQLFHLCVWKKREHKKINPCKNTVNYWDGEQAKGEMVCSPKHIWSSHYIWPAIMHVQHIPTKNIMYNNGLNNW